MIVDFETRLIMVLWTEHLTMELICDVQGVVNENIHLYLDYKLLINCLPKVFGKSKDLAIRAVERRALVVQFILKHLVIQESSGNGASWELSLASDVTVRHNRRRSLSSEGTSITEHSNNAKISEDNTITPHSSFTIELGQLIREQPINQRQYTYDDFSQSFCTIPANSSDYEKIVIPSLREIMKRQSLAMNSSDAYDQLTRGSLRRHTFDTSLENNGNQNNNQLSNNSTSIRGSTKGPGGILLGKVWLQGTEGGVDPTKASEKGSMKFPVTGSSVKHPIVTNPSIKNTEANTPAINNLHLPKIDHPPVQNNPNGASGMTSSRRSQKSPTIDTSHETTEENKKHVYDLLFASDPTGNNKSNNATTNPTSESTVMGSKSQVSLPRIMSPNTNAPPLAGQHQQQPQPTSNPSSLEAQHLGLNNVGDNSTGNITHLSAPAQGAQLIGYRRKSLGNPVPYDRSPLIPEPENGRPPLQPDSKSQKSTSNMTSASSQKYHQPRRSFEPLSSGMLSSAIQTLAKGINFNRPLQPIQRPVATATNHQVSPSGSGK